MFARGGAVLGRNTAHAQLPKGATFVRSVGELAPLIQDHLRRTDGGKACPACLAAALKVEHWDVMKGIRELILAGRALGTYDHCGTCGREQLVLRTRNLTSTARSGGTPDRPSG